MGIPFSSPMFVSVVIRCSCGTIFVVIGNAKDFSKCVLRRKITLNLFVVVKIKVSYPEERFSESSFSLYDLPNHNIKSLSRIL